MDLIKLCKLKDLVIIYCLYLRRGSDELYYLLLMILMILMILYRIISSSYIKITVDEHTIFHLTFSCFYFLWHNIILIHIVLIETLIIFAANHTLFSTNSNNNKKKHNNRKLKLNNFWGEDLCLIENLQWENFSVVKSLFNKQSPEI